MKNKKVIRRIAAAIILCVILLCIIISYFKRNISGNQLLNYMLTENISTIEIRKTRENSNGTEDLGSYHCSAEDIGRFYECLGDSRFKDLGDDSFMITSEIRYYISCKDENGVLIAQMKFYDTYALILDCYYYAKEPAMHRRYRIKSSVLGDFLNQCFE